MNALPPSKIETALTDQELPFVRIAPSRGWFRFGLGEVWRFRELLYFLTWRDVKVRYKQTVFGAGWAVVQPLLMMLIFVVVFGRLARVPSDGVPYPLFAYAGLVPWTLFAQSLTSASNSLVESSNLVTKVYFPRLILPLASGGSYLLDFLIALVIVFAMMGLYRVRPSAAIVWLPLLTLVALLTSLSVGVWLAAINAKYRDVRYAVPFLVQVWLFATPVGYPSSLVPPDWRFLVGLNPMAGVVEGFRWALLGVRPPGSVLFVSTGVTLVVLLSGLVYFRRMERTFADWI